MRHCSLRSLSDVLLYHAHTHTPTPIRLCATGGISEEIRGLQEQSTQMSAKLKNRRAVNDRLAVFVAKASLPPQHAHHLIHGDIDDLYLSYLRSLSDKLTFLKTPFASSSSSTTPSSPSSTSHHPSHSLDDPSSPSAVCPCDTTAGKEVYGQLDKTRTAAIYKIKDHFTAFYAQLKKPRTNVQMLQQQMVKHRYLLFFLYSHAPSLFRELKLEYTMALSKTYASLFRSYLVHLHK